MRSLFTPTNAATLDHFARATIIVADKVVSAVEVGRLSAKCSRELRTFVGALFGRF
jgi:hypothetical protein